MTREKGSKIPDRREVDRKEFRNKWNKEERKNRSSAYIRRKRWVRIRPEKNTKREQRREQIAYEKQIQVKQTA